MDEPDPVEAAAYLAALIVVDGSPDCLQRCDRRKGPWLDAIQEGATKRRVEEMAKKLVDDRTRRQLREIFGR
jgi:hypothetical protein